MNVMCRTIYSAPLSRVFPLTPFAVPTEISVTACEIESQPCPTILTLDSTAGSSPDAMNNTTREDLQMNSLRVVYGMGSALILAGALAGCATYDKCGTADCGSSDAKVTANVRALIDQHPELGAPNSINVQTVDNVVYLNGTVSAGLEGREAQSIALQAPGVKQVVNQLAPIK
jgi:BON domain